MPTINLQFMIIPQTGASLQKQISKSLSDVIVYTFHNGNMHFEQWKSINLSIETAPTKTTYSRSLFFIIFVVTIISESDCTAILWHLIKCPRTYVNKNKEDNQLNIF